MRHIGGIRRRGFAGSLFFTVLLSALAASQTLVAADGNVRLIDKLSRGLAAGFTGKDDSNAESQKGPSPSDSGNSNSRYLQVLKKGSSGRKALQAGIESLPLDNMTRENRQHAEEILQSVSLFRELPTLQFQVEPDVYRFFTRHPEVAVSVWRVMEISKFQMRMTGENEYAADNEDGTSGQIQVLYRGKDQHVILCRGYYKSPLISRSIRADAMIHLQTQFLKGKDDRPYARHIAQMFVSFPSQAVETAARLVSPVSNLIVDRNFQEISMFLYLMSTAMARQPGWVEHVASQLEGVDKVRRGELIDLTAEVYLSARKLRRKKLYGDTHVTIEEVLEPLRRQNPPASSSSTKKPSGIRIIPAGGLPRSEE